MNGPRAGASAVAPCLGRSPVLVAGCWFLVSYWASPTESWGYDAS